MRVLSNHWFLALLLALAMVKGAIYSVVTPPWQAPDEPKYLEYVSLLHEKGRLIIPADSSLPLQRELIQSMAQFDYWPHWGRPQPTPLPTTFEGVWGNSNTVLGSPPLAFLFSLPAFQLVSTSDFATQLYAVRLTSVLLSALVILLAFLVARALFPEDEIMAKAVPALVLFMPMYSFIAGSYTNELMADLSAALWFYIMVLVIKRGFSWHMGLGLPGALAMGLFSKRSSLFLIPLSATCLPFFVSRKKGLARAVGLPALGVLGMVGVVLLITSLPGGQGSLRWAVLDRYFWGPSGAFLQQLTSHDYFSYAYLDLLVSYFRVLFQSFWGVFGWMNVLLDNAWYWALTALSLASLVGLALVLLSPSGEEGSLARWQRNVLWLFLVAIAIALVPIIAQYSAEFTPTAVPQGRYLFPLTIPISILMVLGLRRLVPVPVQRVFPFLLVALMFLFDTASLALYILPFYYG